MHANNIACTDSVLNSYLNVKTEPQTIVYITEKMCGPETEKKFGIKPIAELVNHCLYTCMVLTGMYHSCLSQNDKVTSNYIAMSIIVPAL